MKDDALKTFADGNEVTPGRIWFGILKTATFHALATLTHFVEV